MGTFCLGYLGFYPAWSNIYSDPEWGVRCESWLCPDQCSLRCYLWLADIIAVWFITPWLLPIRALNINIPNSCMLHVMTSQTTQKFMTTGTNWGIPNKKLTCVLLSCLSGLLVNVKCVLLNHLFVIWQQHFSCYHKRVEIKRCWRFLFRAVLTRVSGFIDNLYTGVGTGTSQLCSQKKVINYWLEPSRQFPRIDNKSKGKLWGFEIGFLFSYLYLKCFWDMGWKSWDVKMMIYNLSKNNGA